MASAGIDTTTMFEWWKDLVRPIRITDPQFGRLRYLRDARLWEGHAVVSPTAAEADVLILETRYDALWPQLRQALEAEARRLEIESPEFVLVCVDLPPPGGDADRDWALSYETESPSWHFTVRMTGWVPAGVVAEC